MEKKSLNEAIMEEAGIPNLKDTFEDSRTHVDMPYGLGSAYIESEKRRKEIEDGFKEKDKEMEEYKKMYASEESKTRIKPEVNKKMYLSESLFEDSDNLKFVSNRYSPDTEDYNDDYDDDSTKVKIHYSPRNDATAEVEYSLSYFKRNIINILGKLKHIIDIQLFDDEGNFIKELEFRTVKNESLTEARVGKTKEVIVLQGNYGYGWDDLVEYEVSDYREARADKKDYDENERQYTHRLIRRRVPNPDYKEKEITEAKVRLEDDEDFNDYDMFTFIYNLFTRDMEGKKRPLNPLGKPHTHFDYTSKEEDEYDSGFAPISSTEDSIILYSNDKSSFDDVKEICDKYDFTYREGTKRNENSKYDFNIEIDVPTDYKTGMPMSIEEYFTDLGMEVKDVMPDWYVKRLAASKKTKK